MLSNKSDIIVNFNDTPNTQILTYKPNSDNTWVYNKQFILTDSIYYGFILSVENFNGFNIIPSFLRLYNNLKEIYIYIGNRKINIKPNTIFECQISLGDRFIKIGGNPYAIFTVEITASNLLTINHNNQRFTPL